MESRSYRAKLVNQVDEGHRVSPLHKAAIVVENLVEEQYTMKKSVSVSQTLEIWKQ